MEGDIRVGFIIANGLSKILSDLKKQEWAQSLDKLEDTRLENLIIDKDILQLPKIIR